MDWWQQDGLKATDTQFCEEDYGRMFAMLEDLGEADGYTATCDQPGCSGREFIPDWADPEFFLCPICGAERRI